MLKGVLPNLPSFRWRAAVTPVEANNWSTESSSSSPQPVGVKRRAVCAFWAILPQRWCHLPASRIQSWPRGTVTHRAYGFVLHAAVWPPSHALRRQFVPCRPDSMPQPRMFSPPAGGGGMDCASRNHLGGSQSLVDESIHHANVSAARADHLASPTYR